MQEIKLTAQEINQTTPKDVEFIKGFHGYDILPENSQVTITPINGHTIQRLEGVSHYQLSSPTPSQNILVDFTVTPKMTQMKVGDNREIDPSRLNEWIKSDKFQQYFKRNHVYDKARNVLYIVATYPTNNELERMVWNLTAGPRGKHLTYYELNAYFPDSSQSNVLKQFQVLSSKRYRKRKSDVDGTERGAKRLRTDFTNPISVVIHKEPMGIIPLKTVQIPPTELPPSSTPHGPTVQPHFKAAPCPANPPLTVAPSHTGFNTVPRNLSIQSPPPPSHLSLPSPSPLSLSSLPFSTSTSPPFFPLNPNHFLTSTTLQLPYPPLERINNKLPGLQSLIRPLTHPPPPTTVSPPTTTTTTTTTTTSTSLHSSATTFTSSQPPPTSWPTLDKELHPKQPNLSLARPLYNRIDAPKPLPTPTPNEFVSPSDETYISNNRITPDNTYVRTSPHGNSGHTESGSDLESEIGESEISESETVEDPLEFMPGVQC